MRISTELGMIEVWHRPFNTNGDCGVAQRDFDLANGVDVICWLCSGCVDGDRRSGRVVFDPAHHRCHCRLDSTDMVLKKSCGIHPQRSPSGCLHSGLGSMGNVVQGGHSNPHCLHRRTTRGLDDGWLQ